MADDAMRDMLNRGNRTILLKALQLSESDLGDIPNGNEIVALLAGRAPEQAVRIARFLDEVLCWHDSQSNSWGSDLAPRTDRVGHLTINQGEASCNP